MKASASVRARRAWACSWPLAPVPRRRTGRRWAHRLRHHRRAAVDFGILGVEVVVDAARRERRAVVGELHVAFEVQLSAGPVEDRFVGGSGARPLRKVHVAGRRVELRLRVDVELIADQRRGAAAAVRRVAGFGRVAAVVHDDVADQRRGAALGVTVRLVADRVGAWPQEVHPVRHREVAAVEVPVRLVGLDAVVRRRKPSRRGIGRGRSAQHEKAAEDGQGDGETGLREPAAGHHDVRTAPRRERFP